MDIFKPYVNLAQVGNSVLELHWCHLSIKHAADYYKHVTGRELTLTVILKEYTDLAVAESLFFGALKVSTGATVDDFINLQKKAELVLYPPSPEPCGDPIQIVAIGGPVADGIANYVLIEGGDDPEPEGDPEWPDITPQLKERESEFDLTPFAIALKKHGYSLAEIELMTIGGTMQLIQLLSGVKASDDSWLIGSEDEGDGTSDI